LAAPVTIAVLPLMLSAIIYLFAGLLAEITL